jgi:AraC-like DNA-binding protein
VNKSVTGQALRWDAYPAHRISEVWDVPDLDSVAFRERQARGEVERFAVAGWRTRVSTVGGLGTVDRLRVRQGAEVSVVDCVLPATDRRTYEADEPALMLYATLAGEVVYRVAGCPPIVLTGPELTLLSVPRGAPLTIDVSGGRRQQRVYGMFKHAAIAPALGLDPDRLPDALRAAPHGHATFGRLVSLPLEPHVAALVAQTIATPLGGELRALQYEGRLLELVALAIDALLRPESMRVVQRDGRTAELARRARDRLARDFRRPPEIATLARALGVNANKLRMAFKATYGTTMADFCLDCRMREAQQLLIADRLSIAQIAERVGYEYASGFAAAFAAYVGTTPRDYRRQKAPIRIELGRTRRRRTGPDAAGGERT